MVYIFNVGAFFVLFREALECAIIVGVLLNYIKKTLPHEPDEQKRLRKQVWLGAGVGLIISLVVGVVLTVVFYVLQTDVFAGMEALWEGIMKALAVILITWMAFGMLRAKNWYQKWEHKLETKLQQQAEKDAELVELGKGKTVELDGMHDKELVDSDVKLPLTNSGAGSSDATSAVNEPGVVVIPATPLTKDGETRSLLSDDSSTGTTAVPSESNLPDYKGGLSTRPRALFITAFTIVLREGLESVVFLTGVGQGQPLALILPGVLGILLGLALGWFIYRTAASFRLNLFLLISAICLFFIAAGLAAGVAHEFEEYAFMKRNEGLNAARDASIPANLTVAESPANVWKSLRVRGLEFAKRQEAVVDVAWSPPLRETVTSADCPAVNASSAAPASCIQRTYYIAAEVVTWDYAPSGYNHMNGVPFQRDQEGAGTWTLHGSGRIGAVYDKVMFVEYEDAAYTRRKAKEGPWLGFLGPFIRAEVGDIVKVHFINRSPFPASMHPHGLTYTVPNEGAMNEWNDVGNKIEPGSNYTYTWFAKATAGPAPGDGNSVMWAYHSHVHETRDIYTGLVGPLAVYSPGTLDKTTDKATDVDREYATLLMVADENQSLMLEHNVGKYTPELANNPDAWTTDEFMEMNLMHSVNGRMYNNLDGLEMVAGDKVRWFVFAFGNEVDLHTAHWHGNTLVDSESSHRTDVLPLLPASFHVAMMTATDPGQWLYHCHVADHIHAGMIASYHVKANASEPDITWNVAMAPKEYLPEYPESTPVLWDVSACCSENTNPFFQIMNALVGWQAVATVATVSTYFGYWALVLSAWFLMWYLQRRKERKAEAAKAAAAANPASLEAGKKAKVADAAVVSAPASVAVSLDESESARTGSTVIDVSPDATVEPVVVAGAGAGKAATEAA